MRLIFKLFLTLSPLLLWNCRTITYPEYNDPIPTHESFSIYSNILNETRTINVWKPDNYSLTIDSLFVMYMPDGGIKEDFPHVANTLNELIKTKKIPPMILVGIENTQRRKDLTPTTENEDDKKIAIEVGGSSEFRNFLNNELFPEINKKYRTNHQKGIIGESLAGLFIVETFLKQPEMFDYYIALDPSLWWNDHKMVLNADNNLSNFTTLPKNIWLASSKTKDITPYSKSLAKTLEQINLKNVKWYYSYKPKENHATIYRATKEDALIWSFNE